MDKRGFTIIEIMIASMIVGIVSAMVWSGFSQTSKTTTSVQKDQAKYHELRVALNLIIKDLSSAYLSKNINQLNITRKIIFKGEDTPPIDRLHFVSFNHIRRIKDSHEGDMAEISYFELPDKEEPDIVNLMRRFSPYIDDDPEKGGKAIQIVRDIKEFDVTYYDETTKEWVQTWNTEEATAQPDRLPRQIRIVLVSYDQKGNEITLTTQFPIFLNQPIGIDQILLR